jgi:NAD(P)-dependent dehydrogenase (short-subunit alcohol dehydrogenase family)
MAPNDRTRVLLVGGTSGIAHALSRDLANDGVDVIIGGRNPEQAETALPADLRDRVQIIGLDLAVESTIAAARDLGPLDFVVSLAAAHANGPVQTLDQTAVATAFDAKVIGPILLAKHLADLIRPGGGFVFFSGVAAWKPAAGLSVMATTNGAVAFLVEALAVELAPVRVVGISPGIIDSGAWDAMGEDRKTAMFDSTATANPAGRVGTVADIVQTVRFAMANTFLTGTTLHVDGGGHLS